jgi:NADH:ubiquinone oxidoreductase subunit K
LRTASQSPSEAKRKRLARFVAQAFSFDRLEAQQLAVIIVGITSAEPHIYVGLLHWLFHF